MSVKTFLVSAAILATLTTTSCDKPTPAEAAKPTPAAINGVQLSIPPHQPNPATITGRPLNTIPTCDDQNGHATTWPCQWDSRTHPTHGWANVPPIAIYVRAVDGCPTAVDTGGVGWSCYWRPEDRA